MRTITESKAFVDEVRTFPTLTEAMNFIEDYFYDYHPKGYGTVVKQIMQKITDNQWEVWVQRYPSCD